MPPGHDLAQRPSGLRLSDLAGLPVVCMPPGTGIRAAFDQACAAADIRPAITLEASAAATIADLAARGMGVAILSESMTGAFAGRLRSLLIEDARTPALLTLAWRAPGAPAVAELVRHCQAAFAVA